MEFMFEFECEFEFEFMFMLREGMFEFPALPLFMLPPFEFIPPVFMLPALLLFMLPVFVFELMFELVAFPLALPFALSAGVQAVQTLATARRVRSASVLRIEFPPVPTWGSACWGAARAFARVYASGVLFAARWVGFASKACPSVRFQKDVSGEGSAPQRVTWARLGAARGVAPHLRPAQKLAARNLTQERPELHHFFRGEGRKGNI